MTGRSRAVLRGGAVLTAAQLAWHLSNFAFNSVCARVLGPEHYGTLAVVVALLYVVSPVLIAMQTVVSRLTTELDARGDRAAIHGLLRRATARLGLVAVALVAVAIAVSGPVASFLRLPSWHPLAILWIALGISLFAQIQRGVFQGTHEFGRFAVSSLVEAVTKVTAATIFVTLVWRSEDGAVGGIVASAVAAVVAGWVLLRFLPRPAPVPRLEHLFRYSVATLLTLVLLSALFSMDILAAKHYLSPHAAGVYASVALLGKVAFFGTSAVSVFSFPHFSSQHTHGIDVRRGLAVSLGVIAAVGVAVAAVYWIAPTIVIRPLFGEKYIQARHYIAWMAVAITLYSIAYQAAMYLLSHRRNRGVVVLAFAVAAQLTLLYSVHGSIWQILGVQLGVLGSTAAILVAVCTRRIAVGALEAAPA